MNRQELDKYIKEYYGVSAEFPWPKYPTFAVYRHKSNKKWFAVIMEIPNEKIGINRQGNVTVVNLKCDPMMIGSLLLEEGIHRGYHMNKKYWITVSLDGSVEKQKTEMLLDISYNLTKTNHKTSKWL